MKRLFAVCWVLLFSVGCSVSREGWVTLQAPPTQTPLATVETPSGLERSTAVVPTPTIVEGGELIHNGSFTQGWDGWHVSRFADNDVPQFEPKENSMSVTWLGGIGEAGIEQAVWFSDYSTNKRCHISLYVLDRVFSDLFTTALVVASTPDVYVPDAKQQAVFTSYGFGQYDYTVSVPKLQRFTYIYIGFRKTAEDEFFTVELFNVSFKCSILQ